MKYLRDFEDLWNDKPMLYEKYVLFFGIGLCLMLSLVVLMASMSGFNAYMGLTSPSLNDSFELCFMFILTLTFLGGMMFHIKLFMKRIDWLYRWELDKQTAEANVLSSKTETTGEHKY